MENELKHKSNHTYTIIKTPTSRLFTEDVGQLGRKKHHIKIISEFDITQSRKSLREYKKTNRASFTSWLLKQIVTTLEQHKAIHALKYKKNKLILFDDVDISLTVEKKYNGQLIPIPLIIRKANTKDIQEIFDEIESAKKQVVQHEGDFVLGNDQSKIGIRFFGSLPQWLRLMIWKLILANPHRVKKMMGTVMFTTVGMISEASNWFIPRSIHPVCFAVSNIRKNKTEEREFLQMTILVDHDVVDGMPIARFIRDLKKLIEQK